MKLRILFSLTSVKAILSGKRVSEETTGQATNLEPLLMRKQEACYLGLWALAFFLRSLETT